MKSEGQTALRGAREAESQPQALLLSEHIAVDAQEGVVAPEPWLRRMHTQSGGDRLFVDYLLENRSVVPSLYDGWKAQRVMAAAIAPHRTGRWVAAGKA